MHSTLKPRELQSTEMRLLVIVLVRSTSICPALSGVRTQGRRAWAPMELPGNRPCFIHDVVVAGPPLASSTSLPSAKVPTLVQSQNESPEAHSNRMWRPGSGGTRGERIAETQVYPRSGYSALYPYCTANLLKEVANITKDCNTLTKLC